MKDVTGQKWNRLTAVSFLEWRTFPSGTRQQLWEFVCDCGKTTTAFLPNVRSGHTTSCGCYLNHRRIEAHTKHGDTRNRKPSHLYTVWCGMKQRCEDVNCRLYPRWGGRGISVLWPSYEQFRSDMASTYQPGLQIERIDNNGHYCKENCKWATPTEQSNNRRSNVVLEFNGQRMSVTLWEKKLGFHKDTLRARIKYYGWSVEKALRTPLVGPTILSLNGETRPLREWASRYGIKYQTLWNRLKSGWEFQTALTTPVLGRTAAP